MTLDVVFAAEMRDVGRVVQGLVAATVHGSVDEVVDAAFQSLVNQSFTLLLFRVDILTLAGESLDAENSMNWFVDCFGGIEDARHVVEVASDKLDGW